MEGELKNLVCLFASRSEEGTGRTCADSRTTEYPDHMRRNQGQVSHAPARQRTIRRNGAWRCRHACGTPIPAYSMDARPRPLSRKQSVGCRIILPRFNELLCAYGPLSRSWVKSLHVHGP